jgi:hypothetical protein
MKWMFTTKEWDREISVLDALPTAAISKKLLEERMIYRDFLVEERKKNVEAFFTPEDWFRALHLAVDGEVGLDDNGEIDIKEAGSAYLQETARLNYRIKPTIMDASLQLYPNDDKMYEFRYVPPFRNKYDSNLFYQVYYVSSHQPGISQRHMGKATLAARPSLYSNQNTRLGMIKIPNS